MFKRFSFCFVCLFTIIVASCDVGLGSAVDTEPPVLSIDYPAMDSVIRDYFVLKGSCSDDVGVAQVKVKLYSSDTGSLLHVYNANVDKEKNIWTTEINHSTKDDNGITSYEYKDGKYYVYVEALDDANRSSGNASLSFTIDNTPPLMILTTPGSNSITAPSEYGTVIKVNGTIVDDNSVKLMNMKVYGWDDTVFETTKADWKQSNINTAGGTEVVFAQYVKGGSGDLQDKYTSIYDDAAGGDQKYKVKFVLQDEAKQYIFPAENDKNFDVNALTSEQKILYEKTQIGNSTGKFFFYDEVNSIWVNDNNKTDYKTVQNIINGTNSTITDQAVIEEVMSLYERKSHETATCLINKDASPKYSVLGYTVKTEISNGVESIPEIANLPSAQSGGSITVQAMMGRNSYPVIPSSLQVYQFGPYSSITKERADDLYANVVTRYDELKNVDGKTSPKAEILRGDSDTETKKNESASCETYTYTVKLGTSIKEGQCYLIAVTGKDSNGEAITADGYYILKGSTSAVPPTVIWDSKKIANVNDVADRGYINKANLKFGGTYASTSDITSATYEVTITAENDTAAQVVSSLNGDVTLDSVNNKWSINLKNATGYFVPAAGKEYLYDITVKMKNAGGEGTNNHKIHVDTKLPGIQISAVTPTVETGSGESAKVCVNGKIKIQASVDETALSNVRYEVYYNNDGSSSAVESDDLGKVYTVSKEIDTTKAKDKNAFEVRLIATDEAGNSFTYTTTDYNGSKELYLDQETDKPVIIPNNFEIIKDKSLVREENNVFDNSSNNKINATITDDDGLNKITINYYKENGTALVSTKELDAKGTTTYTLNQALPNTTGIYQVEIKATDKDGHKTTAVDICDKFFVAVDTSNPVITETKINSEASQYVTASGKKDFQGKFSDDWEIDSLVLKVNDEVTDETITKSGDTWSYSFDGSKQTLDSGETSKTFKLSFEATDRAGKTGSVTRNVTIDTKAPVIFGLGINGVKTKENNQYVIKNGTNVIAYDIKKAASESNAEYWFNTNQIPVKAQISDEGGIASVEYSSNYNPSGAEGNGNWTSMIKVEDYWTGNVSCENQGSNSIYVKAKDSAGNQTISTALSVSIDTVEPAGIVEDIDGSQKKYINGEKIESIYVRQDGMVQISVGAEDSGTVGTDSTGIGRIYYVNDTTSVEAEYSEATDLWTLVLDKNIVNAFKNGSNAIKLQIEDKVGNKLTEKVTTIQKDTEAPVAVVNIPSDADESIAGVQINKTITLSGTTNDRQGMKSVEIQYQKVGENTWSTIHKLTTEAAPSTGALSTVTYGASVGDITTWKVDFATRTLGLADGIYYIRAIAEDSAGNIATTKFKEDSTIEREENLITVNILQDSDRPKIYLTNLTLPVTDEATAYLKNTKTLNGAVTDDDGVKNFYYSLDGGHTYGDAVTLGGGGSWSITFTADDEGENKIFFKVEDKGGEIFTSGESVEKQPKITDGTTILAKDASVLIFNLVTVPPSTPVLTYQYYDSVKNIWSGKGNYETELPTIGGIYTKFRVRLNSSSKNIVDSVTAVYNGNIINFECAAASVAGYDGTIAHDWDSPEITVGTEENLTGNIPFAITIKDKAEMSVEKTINISVDNTKPKIAITKPSSLIGSSETIRGTKNETVTLYYGISRYQNADGTAYEQDYVRPDSETAAKVSDDVTLATKWTKIESTDSTSNWYVYFDEDSGIDHTKKLSAFLNEDYLGITTKAAIAAETNPYDTVTPLYFWIKAVDICGNTTYVCQKIMVDPQGERPSVELSYPTDVEEGAPTLGGTIRMTGTASDNNAPKYVWLQIDSDSTVGFGKADLQKLYDNGYTIGKIAENKRITSMFGITDTNAKDYGVMIAVKGTGWSQSINEKNEFNPVTGKSTLRMTLYATDQDEDENQTIHISTPVTQTVYIDANTPYIEASSLEIVQYLKSDGTPCEDGSVSSGTVGPIQDYVNGMSVKGVWFLRGKIKDADSGIGKIDLAGVTKINSTGAEYEPDANGIYFKKESATYNNKTIYNYSFQIPLGNKIAEKVGTSSIKLVAYEAIDSNPSNVDTTFSVIYDNKAPVITKSGTSPFLKLDSVVQNSNGFYTFGTIATEDAVEQVSQSGVKRIAFYFTRDLEYNLYNKSAATYSRHSSTATATHDLFDVMVYHSGNEENDVSSKNTIIDYNASTSGLTEEEGIWWQTVNGTADGTTFVYTGNANQNIHTKGLIKINNVIYLIDGISTTGSGSGAIHTINLSGDTKLNETVSAKFALCNVIDNSGEKNGTSISSTRGYGYGYYTSRSSDDGDLITETFTKQGTDWIFDAAVNSKNLPDGPITVHIVAFDEAGNYSTHTYEGIVSNNAPRIVGMQIGTDEDGNGTVDSTEFIKTYSNKYTLGYDGDKEVTAQTFPLQNTDAVNSLLTIKGKTVMKPELVGGNGDVSYVYSVYERTENNKDWSSTARYVKADSEVLGSGTTDSVMISQDIVLPISDFIGTTNARDTAQIPDGTNKLFKFSFGDSTPGKTLNEGVSNNASIGVVMNVSIREANAARNWILPFYWKGSDDNSLFENSTIKGHIDLSKDLPATFTDNGSGVYTKRPKVSGKVKIEGIAWDDSLLRNITVAFDKKFGSIAAGTATTIVSYANGTWTTTPLTAVTVNGETTYSIPTAGWASSVEQATYGELIRVGLLDELPEGKKDSDLVPYNTQEYGHVIHWVMYIDSSMIDKKAALEVTVTAKASDRGKPVWNTTTNAPDYTANTIIVTNNTVTQSGGSNGDTTVSGTYKMDIVPYITKVYTEMAALQKKESKWSSTSRTSNGNYPVRVMKKNLENQTGDSEVIKIYGFNLKGASYTPNGGNAADLTYGSDTYGEYVSVSAGTLKASATSYSGDFEISVNNIITLNNRNNNDAKGSVSEALSTTNYGTKAYNRLPNGDNNNLLTDDVRFDVWEFNSSAAIPISGKIEQPIMKIRPTDGKIGFAFVNGPLYFSMGGSSEKENYSYQYWMGSYDFFTSVGFTYDNLGNSYGVAAGGDINSSSADKFQLMSSRWGKAGTGQNGSYENTNSKRLESIGQKNASGTREFDKQRIKSPSLTTTVHGTNTNLYLAYYDAMNDEIRFKAGSTSTESYWSIKPIEYVDNSSNYWNYGHITLPADNTGFTNGSTFYFCDKDGNIKDKDGNDSTTAYTAYGVGHNSTDYWFKIHNNSDSSAGAFPLWGGDSTNNGRKYPKTQMFVKIQRTRTLGNFEDSEINKDPYYYRNNTVSMIAKGTDRPAGEYVSLAAITGTSETNDTVVAVWYDNTNRALKYSYNTTPLTDRSGDTTFDGWSTPVTVFDGTDYENAGEYCKITVDSYGGVHIAAYDPVNLDLVYAYLPGNKKGVATKTSDFTSCIVDSSGVVGSNLTLDVGKDSAGNVIPHIGYYITSSIRPKMAYYKGGFANNTTSIEPGSVDDEFTGAWECSIVPTNNVVEMQSNQHNDINIGLWKDSGLIVDSSSNKYTTGTSDHENRPNGYNSTSNGQCYGNGTKNAVLGYAIKHGSSGNNIETAQMK